MENCFDKHTRCNAIRYELPEMLRDIGAIVMFISSANKCAVRGIFHLFLGSNFCSLIKVVQLLKPINFVTRYM